MATKTKIVVLMSGERLEYRGEDSRGVHTDAGVHDWADVLGFRVWSESFDRWFSIPLN